ncbi:MAG: hypothetical protein K1X74_08900 [Pirellulales bacterium]|nr:hypothetical protein [Pirellulales bacterium]
MLRPFGWMAAFGLVCVLATGTASAQGFCYGGGYGYYGNPWSVYSLEQPPYFALHPPVYYSLPVPRTYGYSPFPYGPEVMTPEIEIDVEPQTMMNPYVPQKRGEPASHEQEKVAGRFKRIDNPYVQISNPQPADDAAESVGSTDELVGLLKAWSKLSADDRQTIRALLERATAE